MDCLLLTSLELVGAGRDHADAHSSQNKATQHDGEDKGMSYAVLDGTTAAVNALTPHCIDWICLEDGTAWRMELVDVVANLIGSDWRMELVDVVANCSSIVHVMCIQTPHQHLARMQVRNHHAASDVLQGR
jgi:hypothetical protein